MSGTWSQVLRLGMPSASACLVLLSAHSLTAVLLSAADGNCGYLAVAVSMMLQLHRHQHSSAACQAFLNHVGVLFQKVKPELLHAQRGCSANAASGLHFLKVAFASSHLNAASILQHPFDKLAVAYQLWHVRCYTAATYCML